MVTPNTSQLGQDNSTSSHSTNHRHTPVAQVDKHACQPNILYHSSLGIYAQITSYQRSASMNDGGALMSPRAPYSGQEHMHLESQPL